MSGPLIFVFYALLAFFSHSSAATSLTPFLLAQAILWVLFIPLLFTQKQPSLKAVILWGIFFRIAGMFSLPLLEDDFYRYLWDGFIFAREGNPYASAPSAYFGDTSIPLAFQHILDNINHPDL